MQTQSIVFATVDIYLLSRLLGIYNFVLNINNSTILLANRSVTYVINIVLDFFFINEAYIHTGLYDIAHYNQFLIARTMIICNNNNNILRNPR